jgi:hypothetical protein
MVDAGSEISESWPVHPMTVGAAGAGAFLLEEPGDVRAPR